MVDHASLCLLQHLNGPSDLPPHLRDAKWLSARMASRFDRDYFCFHNDSILPRGNASQERDGPVSEVAIQHSANVYDLAQSVVHWLRSIYE